MTEARLREPPWTAGLERRAGVGAAVPGPKRRPRVWLSRLALTDFRGYGVAELVADGRPLVFCGPNGAGKTNLLEAVSFLAPGRGLRRARPGDIGRQVPGQDAAEPGGWAVAATVVTPDGERRVGTGRETAARDAADDSKNARRAVKIDGAVARGRHSLSEVFSVVWLTPQMDGLLRDGPAPRRRFLDRLVYGFDPAHAGRVAAYEQSLRERARLLKTGRAEDAWLTALEDAMARHGVAIAAARRALVARLSAACAERRGVFPVPGLALDGEVEAWLGDGPALGAEDRLRGGLASARARDAETGGASLGPHRCDLAVRHLGRGLAAEVCSTGEQKALLISIVLAHTRLLTLERGGPPLLLLDEIAAHLDAARRAALYDEILALGVQAWMTGTEAAVFAPFGGAAQFVRVEDAALHPMTAAETNGDVTP